ncbi:E1-E2 ATPase-domain-containing protein [Pilaira anomala]|nr:E1-E2 ATPase-domain-containing protein [Pilaira anomala]
MLTVAAVISLVTGIWENKSSSRPVDESNVGWVDGVAILVVVITNAINNYEKEKQFQKLNKKKEYRPVKVLCGGGLSQQIHIQEIVVGDIMFIEPGDVLNVDCLYIEGHNLRCDESAATGESKSVKKGVDSKGHCIIISGSKITQGVVKVVVVVVEFNSHYERATTLMRNSKEEITPLQLKLNVLANQIAKFGFIVARLMLLTLLINISVNYYINQEWIPKNELSTQLISIVIQAIIITVAAVSEGLPMAVTLALAFATTEMLKGSNLIRHLSACETMGNVTTICSYKTGTLTENKMTVKVSFNNNIKANSIENVCVNSTAFGGRDADARMKFIGPTNKCALLEWKNKLGYSYQELRNSSNCVNVYSFNLINEEYDHCNSNGNECVKPISNCVRLFCKSSLRTLALAYRDIDSVTFSEFHPEDPPLDDLLVLIGIICIQDQLREGVTESNYTKIQTCDNLKAAKAIAKECGIFFTSGGVAMIGPEFRALSPGEQYNTVPRFQVLARSSPIDKNALVAMSGDGTNDGPVLKLANIGFAMGITGTEVAKEASDIILMNCNFNSILQALKWCKAVNDGTLAVELVNRKPLQKDSSLINWQMSRMILGQALFQITVSLLLMYHGAGLFGTLVFKVFVFLQVFNELNRYRINHRLNVLRVCVGSLSIPTGALIRLLPNLIPDDEFNYEVTYFRLRWESVVSRIMKDIHHKKNEDLNYLRDPNKIQSVIDNLRNFKGSDKRHKKA